MQLILHLEFQIETQILNSSFASVQTTMYICVSRACTVN